MTRRVGPILVVAACLLLTACSSTGPAPTAPSTSVPHAQLLERQERLGVVAREIQDLVDPLEGPVAKPLPSGQNRYGMVSIDPEHDRVDLWWEGPLPPEVRAVLRKHPDIEVDVHAARYSNNELHAASERLARIAPPGHAGALGDGVTIDAIEHDVAAGRLTVHVLDPRGRWTVSALHQRLDAVTAVPLDIVLQREPTLRPL